MSELELVRSKKNESSKKCLNEKFMREKRVIEFMLSKLDEKELLKELGEDFVKVKSYYEKKERGEGVKGFNWSLIDGMKIVEVFEKFDKSVKEVCKKGFIVENGVYVKIND